MVHQGVLFTSRVFVVVLCSHRPEPILHPVIAAGLRTAAASVAVQPTKNTIKMPTLFDKLHLYHESGVCDQ